VDDELRTLERAVAAAPGDLAAKVALARALDRAGRLVEAARLLDVSNAEGRALADDLWRRIVRRLRFAVALGKSQGANDVMVSGDGRLLWSSHEDAVRALDDGRIVARTEDVSHAFALRRGFAWDVWAPEQALVRRLVCDGSVYADTVHSVDDLEDIADVSPEGDRVLGGGADGWAVVDLATGARRSLNVPDELDVPGVHRWHVDWAAGWAYGLAGEDLAACDLTGRAPTRLVWRAEQAPGEFSFPEPSVVGIGLIAIDFRGHVTLVEPGTGRSFELPRLGPAPSLSADGSRLRAVRLGTGEANTWRLQVEPTGVGVRPVTQAAGGQVHPFADLAAVGTDADRDTTAIISSKDVVLELRGSWRTWLPDGLGLILERDELLEVWRCD
jgi:hypothetical protein